MPQTTFTVTAGSTLGGIAKKFGVPLGVLIDANGITDPNKIKVGQVLTIPATTTDEMDHDVLPKPAAPSAVTGIEINQKKLRLPLNCFHQEAFPKDLIVLHYTAGSTARSAFDTWVNAANKVATAYVVDVDGTIYEFFDPKHWAHHLGIVGPEAAGFKHHKRSIGIEIVNVGGLKPDPTKPNQLNWWPNNFGTKFCMKSDTSKYVQSKFRGIEFHAAFPEVQQKQVAKLVKHLCESFGIKKEIPPKSKIEAFDVPFAAGFKGVLSHQNFRKDKIDVGPAFDWTKLFS
jgi:N-acetyl-anhydromuramyl-L-alanine amidase AmpD